MTIMQVRSRPGTDHPGQRSPTGHSGPAAPRKVAFWLLALVLGVTMLGTTLPTPLYVIYQGRWHFSAAMVTVTFAVYGVAVGAIFLGSLGTANRLAPAGRRGQAISAFFVACYAGLSIPVVGVGVLSQFTGTFPAVLTFSISLAVLCLFSISRFARGAR